MGKMSDTWRGVETSKRPCETDQGVTTVSRQYYCMVIAYISVVLRRENAHLQETLKDFKK
jgi:hypothetical protein